MHDRADHYRRTYPNNRASWPWVGEEQGRNVIYAIWLMGQNYRSTAPIYGAYPPGYLDRIQALFPDIPSDPQSILHVFSGALPPGAYTRCDMAREAELQCSVYDLAEYASSKFGHKHRWPLVLADPPYSAGDAAIYGTPMVNRRKALNALASVTAPGGFLVWLDTVWPMHRKLQWLTVGRISVIRSTNHRVRLATVFRRTTHEQL